MPMLTQSTFLQSSVDTVRFATHRFNQNNANANAAPHMWAHNKIIASGVWRVRGGSELRDASVNTINNDVYVVILPMVDRADEVLELVEVAV